VGKDRDCPLCFNRSSYRQVEVLEEEMTEKRTIFKKVEPLSMRLLVVVAILALLVQTATMLFVTLREQKSVSVTIINGECK